jgi:hypothetical protein
MSGGHSKAVWTRCVVPVFGAKSGRFVRKVRKSASSSGVQLFRSRRASVAVEPLVRAIPLA